MSAQSTIDSVSTAGALADAAERLPAGRPDMLRIVQSVLTAVVVDVPGPPGEAFARGQQLLDYGLNSLQFLQIHAHLEEALGFEIEKAALFDCPTIGDLVDYLASHR